MTSGQETEWVYSYNPGARMGHFFVRHLAGTLTNLEGSPAEKRQLNVKLAVGFSQCT